MRVSHLIFALTLIAYAVLQLGTDLYSMDLIWVGIIIGTIVWIVEGIVGGLRPISFRRNSNA